MRASAPADTRLRRERERQRGEQQQPAGAQHDARAERAADEARREEQRPDPAADGDARHQAQPPNLAIARLTQELDLEHALGADSLALELIALELEPVRIPIEGFLQRRHDDAGQARFDLAERPARPAGRFELVSRTARLSTEREIGDVDERSR